jgi:ribonuclease D
LQFATPERSAAVDPFEVRELGSFWRLMADDSTTVVVHGGQAEIRFASFSASSNPGKSSTCSWPKVCAAAAILWDIPPSFARARRKTHGRETRTDWRQRPLEH